VRKALRSTVAPLATIRWIMSVVDACHTNNNDVQLCDGIVIYFALTWAVNLSIIAGGRDISRHPNANSVGPRIITGLRRGVPAYSSPLRSNIGGEHSMLLTCFALVPTSRTPIQLAYFAPVTFALYYITIDASHQMTNSASERLCSVSRNRQLISAATYHQRASRWLLTR
jgi:hypothetical protein